MLDRAGIRVNTFSTLLLSKCPFGCVDKGYRKNRPGGYLVSFFLEVGGICKEVPVFDFDGEKENFCALLKTIRLRFGYWNDIGNPLRQDYRERRKDHIRCRPLFWRSAADCCFYLIIRNICRSIPLFIKRRYNLCREFPAIVNIKSYVRLLPFTNRINSAISNCNKGSIGYFKLLLGVFHILPGKPKRNSSTNENASSYKCQNTIYPNGYYCNLVGAPLLLRLTAWNVGGIYICTLLGAGLSVYGLIKIIEGFMVIFNGDFVRKAATFFWVGVGCLVLGASASIIYFFSSLKYNNE
jgi:hypothetical protein